MFDRDDPEPGRRPTTADLKADYDDEFGRVRTPREIARRRLLIPAIDFILFGTCGLLGVLGGTIGVLIEHLEEAVDPLVYAEMVGWLALLALGGLVALVVLFGGIALLNLRRHRLALIAAYIMTSLSLASVYGLLFYPFGIWALVLLYKTEVRREFDPPRPAAPVPDRPAPE